jgi:NAD(P) transhydrogenase subunit alpha
MKLAVPRETRPNERRIALVPEAAGRLVKAGLEVTIETEAGAAAHYSDDAFREKGAKIADNAAATLAGAALVTKVQPPTPEEAAGLPEGSVLLSFLQPAVHADTVKVLLERKVTCFSLDLLPRTSRAQSMDALSSQATVSGYRAVLEAAMRQGKFFPLFMTAAGTVPPAKVLVIGAGVAGLQAIATSRRLGAQVRAYDVRSAAKEEVESLGAKFVELAIESAEGSGGYAKEQSEEYLARQRELMKNEVAAADVVITTAAVPGRKAPLIVTKDMVSAMNEGAVIVDLAADQGGNCEVTEVGKDIDFEGVTVYGPTNPGSSMPTHASFLYSRNIVNFVDLVVKEGDLRLDFEDDIVSGSCVTRNGEVVHPMAKELLAGKL